LRADLARRAPDADEEVHRQHRDLVEEEEHEEVERHEDAEDSGHQRQEERVELLVADPHRPRREHAGEDDDRRQEDHEHRHPVDAELHRDAEGGDERVELAELEPARRHVVDDIDVERERERQSGRDDGDHPHAKRAGPAEQQDEHGRHERRHGDEREHGAGHAHSLHSTSTSRKPAVTP
jgi:hypothetical protein